MASAKSRRARITLILGALFVLLLLVPIVISLANAGGAACFADSACPLSAINPCVRRPAFALVGRCAVFIP